MLPNGAIGFRWGADGRADEGHWNLEAKEARHGDEVKLKLSLLEGRAPRRTKRPRSASRISAGSRASISRTTQQARRAACAPCPCKRIALGKAGEKREALVATVFDLQVGELRRRARSSPASPPPSFDDDTPYTPAWQERITGTPRAQLIAVARQFADNAAQDARQVDGDHRRRR